MNAIPSRVVLGACVAALGGCSFHGTARRWNGHVGPDGRPVFVQTSTYVGLNFAAVVPFVGSTTIEPMIDEATQRIQDDEGHNLRLVETETNNYWWSLPPFSWLFSPVMTSVTFEFEPTAAALAAAGIGTPAAADAPATPGR